MKLYYFPDACSLAPNIALRETGLEFSLEEVDYATRRLRDGSDYRAVNPKGSVPALEMGTGELLTEVSVILQYIAAVDSTCNLLPSDQGLKRYRCLEWLNYVATELHKSVSPLFRTSTPQSFMKPGKDHLVARYQFVEERLRRQPYLLGDHYTIADIYLYVVSRWLPSLGIDPSAWPGLNQFMTRLSRRPSVHAALVAEGLVENSGESLVDNLPDTVRGGAKAIAQKR